METDSDDNKSRKRSYTWPEMPPEYETEEEYDQALRTQKYFLAESDDEDELENKKAKLEQNTPAMKLAKQVKRINLQDEPTVDRLVLFPFSINSFKLPARLQTPFHFYGTIYCGGIPHKKLDFA